MKLTLLFLIMFAIVACKQNNQTAGNTHYALESHPYFSIPVQEEQSILRRQLLNNTLTHLIENKAATSEKFKEVDLFNDYHLTKSELEAYENSKENNAELIVSFSNHNDVYFIPQGISRESLISLLGITPENHGKLYWVESSDSLLIKNKTYYLVSTTLSEMKYNDVYFNSRNIMSKDNFEEKQINLKRHQNIILTFHADQFERLTSTMTRGGTSLKCTKDLQEAGLCGNCSYQIEFSNDQFNLVASDSDDDAEIEVEIDNKKISSDQLIKKELGKGDFSLEIHLKDFTNNENVDLKIKTIPFQKIYKEVGGFSYSDSCQSKSVTAQIDVTPKRIVNLQMVIKGRELENLTIE